MKLLFLSFFLLVYHFNITAQEKETISQNRADLVGIKTLSDFKNPPNADWFNKEYEAYDLDKRTIKKLQKHLENIQIKVFMSVWCHDSHREIPRLYKVLDAINFDSKNLEVIALNRSKKTPDNLQEGYQVIRTPTIIFYEKHEELGRYIEKPIASLEKDMLKIVSHKPYKSAY